MVELLSTKLCIPPLRSDLAPRPRLIQLITDGLRSKRKLTLVSAPAGFEKITLVAAWLKEIDYPMAWLPHFLAYLVAAFQQVDKRIGASLLSALQSPQLPPIEKVLTATLNQIALRIDPLIVVLDDVHLLTAN
jgi:LuxR family maltose regulon positive regulatory protein